MLVDSGADVNAPGTKFENVLLAAFDRHCNHEVIQILVDAGADINSGPKRRQFRDALQEAWREVNAIKFS
jgi:hypothetical protein